MKQFSLRTMLVVVFGIAVLIRFPVVAAIATLLVVIGCVVALPSTWSCLRSRLSVVLLLAGAVTTGALVVATGCGMQVGVNGCNAAVGSYSLSAAMGTFVVHWRPNPRGIGMKHKPPGVEFYFIPPHNITDFAYKLAGTSYFRRGGHTNFEWVFNLPIWWFVAMLVTCPAIASFRRIQSLRRGRAC